MFKTDRWIDKLIDLSKTKSHLKLPRTVSLISLSYFHLYFDKLCTFFQIMQKLKEMMSVC